MARFGGGGGTSRWKDDGSGTLVPSGGEPVSVGDFSVTGETLVELNYGTEQSAFPSSTWTTIEFDGLPTDVAGEYDLPSNQFTPTETGHYLVCLYAVFKVGASSDDIRVRWRDVTAGATKSQAQHKAVSPENSGVGFAQVVEMTAGNTYEPQALNNQSSDTLEAFEDLTMCSVCRVMVE